MDLLRTPDLLLRSWRADDLDAFFDLYSRWEVMRWLGAQPRAAVVDVDEARARLDRWQGVGERLVAPLGLWALVPTVTGSDLDHPVGTVLLLPLEDAGGPTGEVEVGWHLHPDFEGRGLVTKAARALLDAGLAAGHRRVLALTDPANVRSQAVCARLDLVDEGPTDRWFGLTTRQFAHGSDESGQR